MIGILGGGAWGTALGNAAAKAGRTVLIWARDAAQVEEINASHSNHRYLPGLKVAKTVKATVRLAALSQAKIILAVVPAQAMRQVLIQAAPHLGNGASLVICAKGFERGSGAFMSDIVRDCVPHLTPAVLSGPSLAADVMAGLPTAVTLASDDDAHARMLADSLGSPSLRLYHSTDLRGVEIGGAAKNVLAIAAGIVAGRGLGASAIAALSARAFAELARFGRALGAQPETLTGLSGLGDLILSCAGPQTRNFGFGFALGQGESMDSIAAKGKLAEGVFTAEVLVMKAHAAGIEMPIAQAVDLVLKQKLSIDEAIKALMTRPQRAEI